MARAGATERAAARLIIESDTLTPGARQMEDDFRREVAHVIDFFTPRVESYARMNAPWTDRTGNARNGLRATADHTSDTDAIDVAHSVPYGIYLETRFEGAYAIIVPTVQRMGRELMAVFKGLFGRM